MSVADTLKDRGAKYGAFIVNGQLAQDMKSVVREHPKWAKLAPDQQEAIDMILHKIARIVNGDPNLTDSWHDISGYATLVENRLLGIDSHA